MLFFDSSQAYSSTSNVTRRYTSGSIGSVTTVPSGGYGITNPNLLKSFSDVASKQVYIGEEVAPSGSMTLGSLRDGSTIHLLWTLASNGSIQVEIGGSLAVIASSAADVIRYSTGNRYYIEVDALLDAAGHVKVYVDGAKVIDYSGNTLNTITGSTSTYNWDSIGRGGLPSNYVGAHYYAGDGVALAAKFGPILVLRTPMASNAAVQFTPNVNTNYQNVNDALAADDDATYNATSTVGDEDLLNPVAVSSGDTMVGFQVSVTGRRTASGTGTLQTSAKQGATIDHGTAGALGITYIENSRKAYTKLPDGVTAITDAGFNALQFGYKKAS